MPPRICCCENCIIGSDNFNRPNNSNLGPKWIKVSGDAEIKDNHIEVVPNSKIATTACHNPLYTLGSLIARFRLVNLRTVGLFEVGVGDPSSSPWRVQFIPSLMDTPGAKITTRVFGSDGWEEAEIPWPISVFGTSANEMNAEVCYEPKAILRGSLGVVPRVDARIELLGWEDNCYPSISGAVGNFFWTAGHFDDFEFETTILDKWDCPACGCFCFKRTGNTKDWNGYPIVICLTLELTDIMGPSDCLSLDNLTIPLYQGFASTTKYPEKLRWFSEILTCQTGFQYAFIAECNSIVKNGTNWFNALTLRMTDSNYFPSTVIFDWEVPEPNNAKLPDFGLSTCDPLYLVYPNLKLQSFFAPCGPPSPPGTMGYYPFCCGGSVCYPTPPLVKFRAVITEC